MPAKLFRLRVLLAPFAAAGVALVAVAALADSSKSPAELHETQEHNAAQAAQDDARYQT